MQEHVYSGHVITPNLTDDRDIARSKRAICIRANKLSSFVIVPRRLSHYLNLTVVTFTVDICGPIIQNITVKMMVLYNNAFLILFRFDIL